MDTWEKVLFLSLGWLLATLSPIIADAVRRRKETAELKIGLLTELREMKYRLACVTYFIEMRFGSVNRKVLEWLRPIVANYQGPNPSDALLKGIDAQLQLPDEAIVAFVKGHRASSEQGLSVKKIPLPLLDSRIGVLSWLRRDVQALLLEIRTHLRILDEEADNAQYYLRMTFDAGISHENKERIRQNLDNGYRQYGQRAKIIVDRITDLEKAWS